MPRECRTFAAINPAARWGWNETLLNKIAYLLELKLWQDTPIKKGQKDAHMRRKPKPFIPDFMKDRQPESEINKGSVKHTVDDIKSILALPRG